MDSKTLFVDIGNSSINFQIDGVYTTTNLKIFDKSLIPLHKKSIISCVGDKNLITLFNSPIIVHSKNYKNIIFNYDFNQLGVDRFLAIIAGVNLFPNKSVMILDIGTCITIDYIIDNTHYSGGITPGKNLMQNSFNFDGKDSKNAWNTGIKSMIKSYLIDKIDKFNGVVLITGGGQNIIEVQGKNINYYQNLVIKGMVFLAS